MNRLDCLRKYVKKKGALLLLLLLLLSSCRSNHTLTYSDTTPQQNVLRVIGDDGQVIEIAMNQEIDSKSLIALQTALSNRLVIDAEVRQQQAQQRRHDSDLRALYWVLFAIILSLTFLGREYLRQRSKDHD